VPAQATTGDQPPSEDPRRDQQAAPAVVGVAAPAPAPATAPVAEVSAPAPAPPATPAPPASQVAMHIVPLRREADGIHRLTVHLHPADLGPVSVVAEIRDGNVAVQLAGGTEPGRQALHQALPQLRQELLDAGFANCSLDLRQDAPSGGQEYRQPAPARPAADPVAPVATPTEAAARPAVDRNRLLDLRV
jgi:flagellar hook-length control protein FliK